MRAKIILLIISVIARLPLAFSQKIGRLLGWFAYYIPNREYQVSDVNIKLCFPDYSKEAHDRLLKQSLMESAVTMMEIPGTWMGDHRQWLARVQPGTGADLFEQTLAKGQGVIAVGPHLGNWEVGLHQLSSLAPVTALYRPPRQAVLDGLIKRGRSGSGAQLVPATPQGVKAIYAALRRGEMMGVLADQEPKAAGRQGGVFAPFFGLPAITMVLVNRLAHKTGAPVLFWYMERLANGEGFRMHWFDAPEGIADADPVIAATALNQGLEHCIRQCPSQYLWSYKRFYQRPVGESSPYS
ncbi:MAG: lysophospholipid acyltransferase family protein [Sedimenticola sp.]